MEIHLKRIKTLLLEKCYIINCEGFWLIISQFSFCLFLLCGIRYFIDTTQLGAVLSSPTRHSWVKFLVATVLRTDGSGHGALDAVSEDWQSPEYFLFASGRW